MLPKSKAWLLKQRARIAKEGRLKCAWGRVRPSLSAFGDVTLITQIQPECPSGIYLRLAVGSKKDEGAS